MSIAASSDWPPAICGLALCLQYGFGVSKNEPKAIRLLKEASRMGFALAQFRLAQCFLQGTNGVSINPTKGVEYLTQAAELGYNQAQLLLGKCFWQGNGCEQHTANGVHWIHAATLSDMAEAQYLLGCYYLESAENNPTPGVNLLRLASDQDYSEAMVRLAQALMDRERFIVVAPSDEEEAFNHASAVISKGETNAEYYNAAARVLGILLIVGRRNSKDIPQGIKYIQLAIEQGQLLNVSSHTLLQLFQAACSQNNTTLIKLLLTNAPNASVELRDPTAKKNCLQVMAELGMGMVLKTNYPPGIVGELDVLCPTNDIFVNQVLLNQSIIETARLELEFRATLVYGLLTEKKRISSILTDMFLSDPVKLNTRCPDLIYALCERGIIPDEIEQRILEQLEIQRGERRGKRAKVVEFLLFSSVFAYLESKFP